MSEKKKDEDNGTSTSPSKGKSQYLFDIGLKKKKYVGCGKQTTEINSHKSIIEPPQTLVAHG